MKTQTLFLTLLALGAGYMLFKKNSTDTTPQLTPPALPPANPFNFNPVPYNSGNTPNFNAQANNAANIFNQQAGVSGL